MTSHAAGVWIWAIVALLIILMVGEPDLLEAVTAWIGRQP